VGKHMSSQDAQAQEAAARQELQGVKQQIKTAIENHRATMDPLYAREQTLLAQISHFASQNEDASPRHPDSVRSQSTSPNRSSVSSSGWRSPQH
jgi:hypothetical protein